MTDDRVEEFRRTIDLALRELRDDLARRTAESAVLTEPEPSLLAPPRRDLRPLVVEHVAPPPDEPVGVDTAVEPRRPTMRGRVLLLLNTVLVAVVALTALAVIAVTLGPRLLPYQTYFVRSGSMSPAIETGSLVVLTEVDPDELERGDIVTFDNPSRPDMRVTHRIVDIVDDDAGRRLVTKGDANATSDPWRVRPEDATWRYRFDVPVLGSVFHALSTPLARIFLLGLPGVTLIVLRLRRPRRAS